MAHINLAAGAQSSPLPQPVLSSPSLYPRAFYLYLMASNLLLRLGWTYKLSDSLRTSALVPLLFAVVEVLRWVGLEVGYRPASSGIQQMAASFVFDIYISLVST